MSDKLANGLFSLGLLRSPLFSALGFLLILPSTPTAGTVEINIR